MNLQQALVQCRTLVLEGADGIDRSGLTTELIRHGFQVIPLADSLDHVDPTGPYRELLAAPGQLALDGSVIHELVHGPLRHGRSRVTWIQALDFAESVAERDGAFVHLTALGRLPRSASTDADDTADAYVRAFRTLAQHTPVVTLDAGEPDRPPFMSTAACTANSAWAARS